MKRLLASLAVLLLGGCVPPPPPPSSVILDQCKREVLFARCMAALPTGPASTVSNDWAEVVETCDDTARMQSYRQRRFVPLQCRAER